MCIILTNHARMRAKERGIGIKDIISIIESPDIVEEQPENVFCFKKLGNQYLTLIYARDEEGNLVVITVFKTSKLKKYM